MSKYETLMLARTESTDDELMTIENNFEKIFSHVKGSLTTFDKWGKYQLAYPVNKNSYGLYILVRFEIPQKIAGKTLKDLDSFLKIKCNDVVMRHVTVKLDPEAHTLYQKPDPMDGAKSSGIDNLLKEKKIETLLDSVDSSTAAPRAKKPSTPLPEVTIEKAPSLQAEQPVADEVQKEEVQPNNSSDKSTSS